MIKKISVCVRDKVNAVKGRLFLLSINLVSPVPCFASDSFQIASSVQKWAGMIGGAAAVVGVCLIAYAGWKMIMGNMDQGKEKMIHTLMGIGVATAATSIAPLIWSGTGAVI